MSTQNRIFFSLQWRHNGPDGVSNHWLLDCLLSRLFRRRSKKTSKLCVTGLCEGNSPVTGEFPSLMASTTRVPTRWPIFFPENSLIFFWFLKFPEELGKFPEISLIFHGKAISLSFPECVGTLNTETVSIWWRHYVFSEWSVSEQHFPHIISRKIKLIFFSCYSLPLRRHRPSWVHQYYDSSLPGDARDRSISSHDTDLFLQA